MSECTLMIGNPGVGKSTLLNGLVGKAVFKSGVSIAPGLTKVLQMYQAPWGAWYGDTPGLAYTPQAAEEIAKALKTQHGCYKLLFVVRDYAGRISPADVATIKLVLDALPEVRSAYGIIFNKMGKRMIKMFNNDPEAMQKLMATINVGRDNPTAYIHLYATNDELEDENDVVHTLTPELEAFIQQVPFVEIKYGDVGVIHGNKFEALREQVECDLLRALRQGRA